MQNLHERINFFVGIVECKGRTHAVLSRPKWRCAGIAQWWPARTAIPWLSKWRAMFSFGIPGMTNESTLALFAAVPIGRSPGTVARACVAYSSNACS